MMRLLLLLVLLASPALAGNFIGGTIKGGQAGVASDGGGGGASVLTNLPIANVFDTYDPICDPAEASGSTENAPYAFANGIRFCDGFEDAAYIVQGQAGLTNALSDYWSHPSASGGAAAQPIIEPDPDATANDGHGGVIGSYTMCNYNAAGSWSASYANFGAAGTPCAASMGWQDRESGNADPDGSSNQNRAAGYHNVTVDGTVNRAIAAGLTHFSIRFYIKFVGVTSLRCFDAENTSDPRWDSRWQDGGGTAGANSGTPADGTCPHTFVARGSNGYKGIELCPDPLSSCAPNGLGVGQWSTWDGTEAYLPPGGNLPDDVSIHFNLSGSGNNLQHDQCVGVQPGRTCGSANIYNGGSPSSPAAKLHWFNTQDRWIAVELVYNAIDSTGMAEIYMNDCGPTGLDCAGQAQTLWSGVYNQNFAFVGTPSGSKFQGFYFNFWGRGQTGEIQYDELVVKDRSCSGCDTNIGWAPNRVP